MNFVAHVEVAHRSTRPPAPSHGARLGSVLVGAALPDLASIGGFRLEPHTAEGGLAEGIRLHHRTDDVFHGDERFRALMGRLRTALLAAGVGRGAARACGHVGVELLLDGRLLADPEVVVRTDGLLSAIHRPDADVVAAVAGPLRPAWREHLRLVAERITPDAYREADLVAGRLHRILSRRPRLALAEGDVPVLAGALRRIQPEVDEVARDLVTDTAGAVR